VTFLLTPRTGNVFTGRKDFVDELVRELSSKTGSDFAYQPLVRLENKPSTRSENTAICDFSINFLLNSRETRESIAKFYYGISPIISPLFSSQGILRIRTIDPNLLTKGVLSMAKRKRAN
jgi:hypothetical protein